MAAKKYISDVSGILTEIQATVISAGAGDDGEIVALDATGKLDISVMPAGIGAEVRVVPASENLTAGNWINLHDNTGATNARKADATGATKPCDGFVLANVTAPANATVYGISQTNTGVSGLTPSTVYYLHTTAGSQTTTAPSSSGNIVQRLGKTDAAASLLFDNVMYWVKA